MGATMQSNGNPQHPICIYIYIEMYGDMCTYVYIYIYIDMDTLDPRIVCMELCELRGGSS